MFEMQDEPHTLSNIYAHSIHVMDAILYGNNGQEAAMRKVSIGDVEVYYSHGMVHRNDGAAIVSHDTKTKIWFEYGYLHRHGGPAYIHKKQHRYYYKGMLHNTNGPAIIKFDDDDNIDFCYWYVNGARYVIMDEYIEAVELFLRKKTCKNEMVYLLLRYGMENDVCETDNHEEFDVDMMSI